MPSPDRERSFRKIAVSGTVISAAGYSLRKILCLELRKLTHSELQPYFLCLYEGLEVAEFAAANIFYAYTRGWKLVSLPKPYLL
ncbi:hypothetical protein DFP95_102370 [Cohnella lupini]|uniref:Uncharacterized protein n=1 Tax=Cohnella lupini TaxID=1294267 RepID=A0A3D9IT96_9BACL|nr:hypothetical protein DFP95_102370 [Cohnella lupini]